MTAISDYPNLKPWRPGQSGNPNGRPLGSRSAFSAGFTRDLAEVWAEKGKAAMLYTAEKQPAVFFATCARLLPNDVRVTVTTTGSGTSSSASSGSSGGGSSSGGAGAPPSIPNAPCGDGFPIDAWGGGN